MMILLEENLLLFVFLWICCLLALYQDICVILVFLWL
jgi:hypothetical protein